jgi:hypothetical protein
MPLFFVGALEST